MRRGGPRRAAGMSHNSIQPFRINTIFYFRGGFCATPEQGSNQRLGKVCAGCGLSGFRTAVFDIFYFLNIFEMLMASENRMDRWGCRTKAVHGILHEPMGPASQCRVGAKIWYFFDLLVEGAAADAEPQRGRRLVPVALLENLPEQPGFVFRDGFARGRGLFSSGAEHQGRQVDGFHRAPLGQHDGMFDGVLQLAHVARPVVGKKGAHGFGVELADIFSLRSGKPL